MGGMRFVLPIRLLARSARVLGAALLTCAAAAAPLSPAGLAQAWREQVDRSLQVPAEEAQRYAAEAEQAFGRASIAPQGDQYLLVVDRDAQVQAALLFWRSAQGAYELVGASPVSTGSPGSFDHFETPLGVFVHGPWNPDFRAEGTFNDNGIRGYGARGMRVFDFGWQRVPKGWGDRAVIDMRLQMHATDPDVLEARLGSPQSKGCIRIPATLNVLLDRHGVLDAEYDRLLGEGQKFWVLREDRDVVADAGRYLVVVDTRRGERPAWSPAPRLPHRPVPPAR
jgi:hypothetical protein